MVGQTGGGRGRRDGDPVGRFAPGGAMSGRPGGRQPGAGQADDSTVAVGTAGLTSEDEANLPVAGAGTAATARAAPPLAARMPQIAAGGSGDAPGLGTVNGRSLETAITGPAKREVDLYVRTYSTLLQSSGAVSVSSLEPAHVVAAASLHAGATEAAPDMNAFMYSTQRLPASIVDVRRIVLAQSRHDFEAAGFRQLDDWQIQSAPGRRRRWLFDGDETLVAYIASASDLDDAVPTIVAWQIEWNKFHRLFAADPELTAEVRALAAGEGVPPSDGAFDRIGERLLIAPNDWARLRTVWGVRLWPNLAKMAEARKRFSIQLLGGTHNGYARSARQWWDPIAVKLDALGLSGRPLYFVSSNTHSIANVLSGTARRRSDAIVDSIRRTGHAELIPELELFERGESRSPWENWLYFAARSYFAAPGMAEERERRNAEERAAGIHTLDPRGAVDVGVQIIDVAQLDPAAFDPRLRGGTDRVVDGGPDADGRDADGFDGRAEGSDAVIININYPLGLAAYYLLSEIGVAIDAVQGIYVLGKAATLNGRIGDVMISNVVYDEHSNNTYWFDNCFGYGNLAPYLVFGDLLDNQKAVTVKGTYLQNQGYLDFFYREAYTVVEMEAGPYLSTICEELFPRRYPTGEAVNLQSAMRASGGQTGVDLGILHYASDTPYTRAQTLGARGMDFYGLDSTYASTIAILRRIFDRERHRLRT